MYPYNPFRGQKIQTHASADVDRAFIAHYSIVPEAESDVGVLAATDLDATVKSVTTGLNNPDVPRNLKVKGNASGVNNVVKIHGTNFADEVISEEITPNGTTAVAGTLAFKTVTKVDLPVEDHTSAKQKTTSAVTAATGAGAVTLTVTAEIFGTPATRDVTFTLAAGDVSTTTTAATAIKNALNADPVVGAHFAVTSSSANVIMEAKVAAPQDATINLVVKTVGDTGLTIGAITVNTTEGVRDRISVGWGKSIGLPYRLPADELVILKLFDNSADNGTVTPDATDIEKNVIALAGTPDGEKSADLYILA